MARPPPRRPQRPPPAVCPTVTLALISRQPLSGQPRALALVGVVVVLAHLAVLEWRWGGEFGHIKPDAPAIQVMSVRVMPASKPTEPMPLVAPMAEASDDSRPAPNPIRQDATPQPDQEPGNPAGQTGLAANQSPAQPGEAVGLPDLPSAPVPLSDIEPPAAMRLSYLARRASVNGTALLDWAPDGSGQYSLQWQVMLPGRSPVDWFSRGEIGADGIRPMRMVERRQGRDRAAVNFQRDKGIISFSSSSRSFELAAGTQDRASWLMQLPMLALAYDTTLRTGSPLVMPMATTRGEVMLWLFVTVDQVPIKLPSGQVVNAWHLVRQPERPYDLRIEVWLAADHSMLPVQLHLGVQPGDDPLELSLLGELPESTRSRRAVADPSDASSDPATSRTP